MRDAGRPRLLLVLPTTTYRAAAFVEAAARLDIDLTVASERDSAFSAAQPSQLLTLDFSNPEGAGELVKAFAAQHPVTAVFGVDDETAVVAAYASRALGLAHNTVDAVRAAGDKHRQRVLLKAQGVPVPRFVLDDVTADPEQLARAVEYPCVLKPLNLAASRGVMRANDPTQFTRALTRLRALLERPELAANGESIKWFLVEDYVPGPEFALEGLLDNGRLHVLALFDKPDPLEGPFFAETIYVTPSRFPRDVQCALVECAEQAVHALGLDRGPVHVELRYNDQGPWLIELAARPIGGKCGQILRFGADGSRSLEEVLLGHALGLLETVPAREPVAVGVMMLPVPRAGVFSELTGIREALGVPGVSDVIVTAHSGQYLVPLPEESRYPGFVFARGETPDAVEQAIRTAFQKLEFRLE